VGKIPVPVYVCLTVAFLAVIGVFGWLSAIGADGTEFRSFLNTVVNLVTRLVSGVAAAYAGKAAAQTNGDLDQRIEEAVTASLDRQRTNDGGRVSADALVIGERTIPNTGHVR
jgi:hypothetical protein